ncbi:MAG: Uma2 family endonuclease [Gemmatales bacterium]
MGSSATRTESLMTVEEFMLRPEPANGALEELVDGKVITMPPPGAGHGIFCARIVAILLQFVQPRKLGWVASNDSGTILKHNPDSVRGPDVAFYSIERVPAVPQGYFEVAPDLAVEVISPSDSASYVQNKVVQYLEAGVQLIWVVYPASRDVVVYHSLDRVQHLTEQQSLDGGSVLPGFTYRIAELFGEIRS